MKLIFCDLQDDRVRALKEKFESYPEVKIRKADLTRIKADAWATAGNSFGDMGGGVDKAIDDYFNGAAQPAVQTAIKKDYFGELPVGCSVAVKPASRKPTIIYAPTMRVPGRLPPSINPYLAMRSVLITAITEEIKSLACPLFGTGVGGLSAADAADQLFQAYRLIVGKEWQTIQHSLQAPYVMRD